MTRHPPAARPCRLGVALALLALVAQWWWVASSAAHQARWLAGAPWAAVCTSSTDATTPSSGGAVAQAADACAVCAVAALPFALTTVAARADTAHADAPAPRRRTAAPPHADATLRPPVRAPPRA